MINHSETWSIKPPHPFYYSHDLLGHKFWQGTAGMPFLFSMSGESAGDGCGKFNRASLLELLLDFLGLECPRWFFHLHVWCLGWDNCGSVWNSLSTWGFFGWLAWAFSKYSILGVVGLLTWWSTSLWASVPKKEVEISWHSFTST